MKSLASGDIINMTPQSPHLVSSQLERGGGPGALHLVGLTSAHRHRPRSGTVSGQLGAVAASLGGRQSAAGGGVVYGAGTGQHEVGGGGGQVGGGCGLTEDAVRRLVALPAAASVYPCAGEDSVGNEVGI